MALLDDKMSKLLKKQVEGDKKTALSELNFLSKKYKAEEVAGAYLKFVAEDKKEAIIKRM